MSVDGVGRGVDSPVLAGRDGTRSGEFTCLVHSVRNARYQVPVHLFANDIGQTIFVPFTFETSYFTKVLALKRTQRTSFSEESSKKQVKREGCETQDTTILSMTWKSVNYQSFV